MRLPEWARKLPLSTILLVVLLANVLYDLFKEKRMEWIDYLFIIGIIYCIFDITMRFREKRAAKQAADAASEQDQHKQDSNT